MCAGNNYSEDGVNMIAHALKENKSLRFLSLAGNPLTDQSVAHLAQVLRSNACLQSLNLSSFGGLGPASCRCLVDALTQSTIKPPVLTSCNVSCAASWSFLPSHPPLHPRTTALSLSLSLPTHLLLCLIVPSVFVLSCRQL